jgi:hypothetical protein
MDLSEVDRRMADWTLVRSLDLTSNPLTCDCRVKWLHSLVSEDMLNANASSSLTVHAVCTRCPFYEPTFRPNGFRTNFYPSILHKNSYKVPIQFKTKFLDLKALETWI